MDRKIQFVTNEADERPIYAVFGDILWCRDTGNEYTYDGSTWQEYKMRYKDLGLVIDAVNVAAGATVSGNVYNNLQWVRRLKYMTKCDQSPQLSIVFYDSDDSESLPVTSTALVASPTSWNQSNVDPLTPSNKIKFSLKNTGGGVAAILKLRIQLFGL